MQDSGQLQLFNGPLGSAFYKIADVYHNLVEKNEQTEQENKNLRELASFTLFAKTVTLEITLIKKDPLRSNPMGAINVSQEVTMRIWLRQMRAQKGVSQASAARELVDKLTACLAEKKREIHTLNQDKQELSKHSRSLEAMLVDLYKKLKSELQKTLVQVGQEVNLEGQAWTVREVCTKARLSQGTGSVSIWARVSDLKGVE